MPLSMKKLATKFTSLLLAFLLLGITPTTLVFADAASTEASSSSTTGTNGPTGADAGTYHFNATTGKWENDYYIWDPATGQTTPKQPQAYSYNPATGKWDTTEWRYDATSNKYVPNITEVSTPPATETDTPTSTKDTSPATSTGTTPTTTPTVADKDTPTDISKDTNTTTYDGFYNAGISNKITSQATSGTVSADSNTTVGDATSGKALSMANLVNLLQSSMGSAGNASGLVTFNTTINGDVTGDLLLDPSQIGALQAAGNTKQDVTVNNSTNATIDNKLTIGAQSGDVSVTNNTAAGNATSGAANAVANIVNVINSAITSGKSFLGVINIDGNLDGDILLPPNFIDQLIAANTPTTTINTGDIATNTTVNNTTNNAITNTITTNAKSGDVAIDHNTTAGTATSGNSKTNITVFNLTGSDVIGSNALLVFVNVLGKWVGMIVNTPTGATSAALGGNLTQNTTTAGSNTTVKNTANQTINNDINLTAQSGTVSATNNTKVGNAGSGNATASANLLNINSSNLSLSNWFGMLFINVFGSWHGSFGINTNAGNILLSPDPVAANPAASTPVPTSTTPESFKTRAFTFVPKTSLSNTDGSTTTEETPIASAPTVLSLAPKTGVVLAAQTTKPSNPQALSGAPGNKFTRIVLPVAGLLAGIGLLAAATRTKKVVH